MRDRQKIVEMVTATADKFGPSNPQQLNKLSSYCKKTSENEVFFGLFSFFYDPSLQENKFHRQQLAGTLLFEVAPASSLGLDGSIYAAASLWDYSIEELPWYWCKVFGTNAVENFLNDLLPNIEDETTIKCIKTMLFWCHSYEQQCT